MILTENHKVFLTVSLSLSLRCVLDDLTQLWSPIWISAIVSLWTSLCILIQNGSHDNIDNYCFLPPLHLWEVFELVWTFNFWDFITNIKNALLFKNPCCLYEVGFAETVLVISAATSVSASPRAGHPNPVTIQVDRYRCPSKGMLSSLDRLLAEWSISLGLVWHVVVMEADLSFCCLLMSLNRALEFLDYAESSQVWYSSLILHLDV